MKCSAIIRHNGTHRYELRRIWDDSLPCATFIMLNPSTADAEEDDPTIRRCIGFARRLACGAIKVVNLFSLRATDPKVLRTAVRPVGIYNDRYLAKCLEDYLVIVAWGAWVPFEQDLHVWELLKARPLYCLGVTSKGKPRHPLYLANNTELKVFTYWDGP